MTIPFVASLFLVAIGLAFIVTETPLCLNQCWIEQMLDELLPAGLEAFSGGLPWLAVGIALAVRSFSASHK
jgi:hypothetical protein